MKKRFLSFLLIIFCASAFFPQIVSEKGVPWIDNYSLQDYGDVGKVWETSASSKGLVYFATEKGLLEFDGKDWVLYKGSKGITRSVFVASDSLIYTGSDMDFGVWRRNQLYDFEYQSLYPYKQVASKESEEFWDTYVLNGNPVFISHQNLYIQKKGKITKIKAPYKFNGSYFVDHQIFLVDERFGLYRFSGDSLEPIYNKDLDVVSNISGICKKGKGLLLVTRNNGLYDFQSGVLQPIQNSISQKIKSDKVFSFTTIGNMYWVFGTILNGVYITDNQGNIIHHINKHKGLQNNTILSLSYDTFGNLWMGTDYGLSKINLNNKMTYFFDYQGVYGTAYAGLQKGNEFYLGTNQGLYTSVWSNLDSDKYVDTFAMVPGSEGQVWCLANVKDEVLVGHDRGLFSFKDNQFKNLNQEHGVWVIKPYGDNFLLTGNYNGISIYKREADQWKFQRKMEFIAGSCNQIEIENNNVIWINIPNYGIIRAELDAHLKPKSRKMFLSQKFMGNTLDLVKENGKVVVKTEYYDYTFDNHSKEFIRTLSFKVTPEVKERLSNFGVPSQLNPDYLFYPVHNGFALLNTQEKSSKIAEPTLVFRGMKVFNNDDIQQFSASEVIPNKFNNIKLNFIVPQAENAVYQYRFGTEKEWSKWTSNHNFEFLNLGEGRYKFYVRAQVNGKIIEAEPVVFKIAAPWYRSWVAFVVYFILFILAIRGLAWRQRQLLKKQKFELLKKEQESLRVMAEKHREEQLIMEQKQLEREKDSLEQKVKDKTIELAKKAKDDEDKNRILLTLKQKIEDAQLNPSHSTMRWKEINRMLDDYLSVEDKTFEIQMDELHQGFFKNLRNAHPNLSIYDLRLSAYLKIGLNSNEIADILNVQPSSVYVSRSRLRKKLDLGQDDDLHDFLNRF